MTAEGNVADTGIVEEAKQLIAEKRASDMPEALEILKQQAKRDKDKKKWKKLKEPRKPLVANIADTAAKRRRPKRKLLKETSPQISLQLV
ncbi:polymorphic toxin type 34 domain-containing protein [Microcoleus sp. LAD1_D3]|uniref:polymorphic toxin type 34 domain-containing protein n=1 Tax=Microcoleus sp. LAD1_D3 TaxID=2819365 RepID=UPI002FD49330